MYHNVARACIIFKHRLVRVTACTLSMNLNTSTGACVSRVVVKKSFVYDVCASVSSAPEQAETHRTAREVITIGHPKFHSLSCVAAMSKLKEVMPTRLTARQPCHEAMHNTQQTVELEQLNV